jgi:diguanylate cyclase (GGDEF)-like protein/PAS domain S-box-containing protein
LLTTVLQNSGGGYWWHSVFNKIGTAVFGYRAFRHFWSTFPGIPSRRIVGAEWWRGPHILPSAAAGVIGVILSLIAWFAVSAREDRLSQLDLDARTHSKVLGLQNGIDNYMGGLVALRALFEASDRAIGRQEFSSFSQSLQQGRTAILAFSWLPRILQSQRAAHELAAASEGLLHYQIKSVRAGGGLGPAAEKSEYFPVFYSTRESSASPLYGLDLNDGGVRQETLERARDSDRLTTSASFMLRSGEGDRAGFFVVLPVFRHSLPHGTLRERRDNLAGFVQGVFQIGVMIETVLRTATTGEGLDLYFYPEDAGIDAPALYFYASRARSKPIEQKPRTALLAAAHRSAEINVGDRRWTLVAAPVPGGPGTSSHLGSWIVLAGALLITALLVAYVWATARQAERLQRTNKALDRTRAALDVQNVRFDTALKNMSQALLMFDASGRLMMSNQRYCEMYGLEPDLIKPGCTIGDLLEVRRDKGAFSGDARLYLEVLQSSLSQGKTFEDRAELPDGRTIAIVNRPMPQGGWVATHEDITERRRAEAKISYMARHDALTDLPNRILFQERMEEALSRTTRGGSLAVLCLDIDHFKGVNDALGHPVGDILLKQVADRLRECVRDTDTVARVGGDEFAIVQPSVSSQLTDATGLATQLIETISAPYDIEGHQIIVGMSVGIAIAPGDGIQPHQLLKSADMALYRAKADGRGVYRFFEPEMDARMQARRALELDLRRAIVAGEFELFYQPLVDVRTQYVRGFEALIRWHHPERGVIAPLNFIPLAEETGLIIPLGEWILRQACSQATAWPADVSVSVNLSPVQFKSKNLVAAVVSALAASGLPPTRLELEITESVLLQDDAATVTMLHQFRSLGVRISMDDFGTGYSSLSYLRKFPFDKIKIDGSFIRDMADRDESLAIVRAVTAMGASLGIVTTAEGVETREQLDQLRAEGCVEAQGYLFSPPRPAAEVKDLLYALNPGLKAIA